MQIYSLKTECGITAQVNTTNETIKPGFSTKVFWLSRQIIPYFHNAFLKIVMSNVQAAYTWKQLIGVTTSAYAGNSIQDVQLSVLLLTYLFFVYMYFVYEFYKY